MRKMILVSMDEKFAKKFVGMIHNINAVNSDKGISVIIENIYNEQEIEGGVVINGNFPKEPF